MSLLDNETRHQWDLRQMLRVRLQRLRTTCTLKYLLHTTACPSLEEAANHLGGEFDEEGQQVLKRKSLVLCRIPSQRNTKCNNVRELAPQTELLGLF